MGRVLTKTENPGRGAAAWGGVEEGLNSLISLAVYEGSNFSISLSTLTIACLFNFSHSNMCKVVSHCSFDSYLSLMMLSVFSYTY